MTKRFFIPTEIETIITYDHATARVSTPYHICSGYFEMALVVLEPEAVIEKPPAKKKRRTRKQKATPKAPIAKRDMKKMPKTFHSRTPPPPPIPTTTVNGFRYLFNSVSGECTRLPATQPFDERLREMLDNGFVLVTKAEYQTLKAGER